MESVADSDQDFVVTDNAATGRFELRRSGELVGFATYRTQGSAVVVSHVETLWQHRDRGYGARLMDGILGILRTDARTIVPLCAYAASYMRDHPEDGDLLQSR